VDDYARARSDDVVDHYVVLDHVVGLHLRGDCPAMMPPAMPPPARPPANPSKPPA
jgi:hypothetical protein